MTDIADIQRRAEAGEAEAQYAFAAVVARRGQTEAARRWLALAADQGHADALFTLACGLLTLTEGAAQNRVEAIEALQKSRDRGSVSALRMLAALTAAGLAGDGGWPEALKMMREACERGDAAAKREIATLAFESAEDDEAGETLLSEAAQSDRVAGALVERRRERGRSTRHGEVRIDRALACIASLADTDAKEQICDRPRMVAVRRACGPDLCDHLIAVALPRLKREQILDFNAERKIHHDRTAWGAGLGFGFADLPSVFAGQRMARLAGMPYAHGEMMSVFRYRPGEEYRKHHDFLGPKDPDLAAHGQRVRTALMYLNEGYVGGETHFFAPDIQFAGKAGDVLFFDNVDKNGAPDVLACHAGKPVAVGEKWLASIWFRDRPFAG